jgi:hypothetical protein
MPYIIKAKGGTLVEAWGVARNDETVEKVEESTDPVGVFERGTGRLVCVFPSKEACTSVVTKDRPVVSWYNYYRATL